MKYVYTQHAQGKDAVIFECEAGDILRADAKLLESLKIRADKRNDITCWSPDWKKVNARVE